MSVSMKRSQKWQSSTRMEVDKLKEIMGEQEREQMKNDLAIQAAVEMITDAAVEVEAAPAE